ncbi:hypothetical protein BBG47_27185 [Paenibacillus sp. KS1]|nr:hypothetical protein BBG47_27185 [Paenibacillus sp. KS1]
MGGIWYFIVAVYIRREIIISNKRLTFNEDVNNYEKWRPTYCDELFEDILEYSQKNLQYAILHLKNLSVQMIVLISFIQLLHFTGFQKKSAIQKSQNY